TDDAPGVGFNDTTPATPVSGYNGATVGQQRQIVFEAAARLWGKNLNSDVPITVWARFSPLFCTATQAVLGSAGPLNVFFGYSNLRPDTWYPAALANKLQATRLVVLEGGDPDDLFSSDIRASFNGDLGNANCL